MEKDPLAIDDVKIEPKVEIIEDEIEDDDDDDDDDDEDEDNLTEFNLAGDSRSNYSKSVVRHPHHHSGFEISQFDTNQKLTQHQINLLKQYLSEKEVIDDQSDDEKVKKLKVENHLLRQTLLNLLN
jgi:hypothetical protein